MNGALDGIRILDLSRVLAGPWATQLLGDYGADVVKIERPETGDDTRQWGPPWLGRESAYFLATNRNKRSVTIDLASDEGKALVCSLADEADILVENFRVGALRRLDLDPENLRKRNPGLIVCSISAFGQSGSRAQEPGYDAMIQASAGLMSITGPEEGGPQKVGVAIADIMAGMYAANAILAALHARQRSGKGQHIDIPLYDSQVAWLANQAMNYLVSGIAPGRMGTAHPNLVPYQSFTTSDGNLMLAVGNERQFARCMACIGCDGLEDDPRFASNAARIAHRGELVAIIGERLRHETTAYWLKKLAEHGVPAGPINDIAEVLGNDFARERGLVRSIRNSAGNDVPLVSNPVDFSATPVVYGRAPPRLGEHTEEVLRDWLGYSAKAIDLLRSKAAI
jgi:crotonobetainyl-CoA:carnitine CoA-transferase CaiB-like acyl-CoA transferase